VKLDYRKQSSEKRLQYSSKRYSGSALAHGHVDKNQMTSNKRHSIAKLQNGAYSKHAIKKAGVILRPCL